MPTKKPADSSEVVARGMVDVKQLGVEYRVGRSRAYAWMKSGQLGYVLLGRRRLVPRSEIERLLAANYVAPQPAQDAAPAPAAE